MFRKRRPPAALALIATVALISACGSSGSGDPSSSHQGKAVKFSECMRSHGVGNFPDPDASGHLTIDQVANGTSVNMNTPAATQALNACKSLEPAGFTGTTRTPAQQAAALKFAQCIRENGVSDFPDPGPNQPTIDTNRIPSAHQPGGMDALHAAMQKCNGGPAQAGVHR